jgi:hypothetical protein
MLRGWHRVNKCPRVDIGFSIGNDARLSDRSDTGMIAT